MRSDLAITVTIGSAAMALVALLLWWVGRATSSETLSWEKKLGFWNKTTRASEERFAAGHRAARPFMRRYANILGFFAVASIVVAFFSDIAAAVLYVLGLIFLVLGLAVVHKKANSAPLASEKATS